MGYRKVLRLYRRHPDNQIWIRNNLAVLEILRGDNLKALAIYEKLVRGLAEKSLHPEAVLIFCNAARASLEAGRYNLARDFIERGKRFCSPAWDFSSQSLMDEIEAGFMMAFHRWSEAEGALKRLQMEYHRRQNIYREEGIELSLARLYRLTGRTNEAEQVMSVIMERQR